MSESTNNRSKPKGKRPMFWIGFKGSECVMVESSSKEAAEAQVDKLAFDIPFYKVKGFNKGNQNSLAVTLKASDVRYTGNTYTGVFQGWNFIANGLKATNVDGQSFDDDELIVPQFESPVDSSNKSPKPRVKINTAIRVSDAEDVELSS